MTSNNQFLSGKVAEWDRQKGYGFLGTGRERIFLHRRDFQVWRGVPQVGELIQYVRGRDAAGRLCAVQAVQTGNGISRAAGAVSWPGLLFLLALLLTVPVVAGWVYDFDNLGWGAYFMAVNLLTWRCYGGDKRCAREGAWRTPEVAMHFLEIMGGWPAAFLAQRRLRHKCAKTSYQIVFWGIVLLYQFTAWDALHQWKYSKAALQELEVMTARLD